MFSKGQEIPNTAQIINLADVRRARHAAQYRDPIAERISVRRSIRPRIENWLLDCFEQKDAFKIDIAEIATKVGVLEIDVFFVVRDLTVTLGFMFWQNTNGSIYDIERAPALARKRD